MNNKLYQLFEPYEEFPQIRQIIRYGEIYADTFTNSVFTMDHIIYGYMKYCESSILSLDSQYIHHALYASKYMKKSYEKIICESNIDQDVYVFSDWYKKYFRFMINNSYRDEFLSALYFYYLIAYMKQNKMFKHGFFAIIPDSCEVSYEEFCTALNSIIVLHLSSDCSMYSTPLKIDHTRDLTNLAYSGKLPELIGRETELNRLTIILSKMIKNNSVIIGNPGVGKTSIVQELAIKLVKGEVRDTLKGYTILELDLTSIIAGCRYRGDFEQNIKVLFEKIKKSKREKVILFIDEIHLITNLGKVDDGNTMSMSSMLKPFMVDSNIKIIGASTFKDFKLFESDKALERRFDTITISEPSFEQTIEILDYRKPKFEKNFNLKIPISTLEEIVSLSNQYIPERFQPDKAIDLLDEACSIKCSSSQEDCILSEQDILVAISSLTGIPMDKLRNSDSFNNLEEELSSKVIGQPHAITSLVKAIRRTKAGLNDNNRPLASFMFVGPTGVGKTEISKILADSIFVGRNNMIRFDMSEYMEEHSVSKLIGSPPGYVGYKEGGQLTDQVRRHPFSLILFDEIEKAHPKICNLLLQLLDEGALTDSQGDTINFKNTIIILTSNVGVRETTKTALGFCDKSDEVSKNVLNAVKERFTPEFLNRLDEVIMFNHLTKDDIIKITKICISTEIVNKLNSRNISIDISDEVIAEIANHGYCSEYGARELKRTITRELKNPLADFLIKFPDAKNVSVGLVDGNLDFSSNDLAFAY